MPAFFRARFTRSTTIGPDLERVVDGRDGRAAVPALGDGEDAPGGLEDAARDSRDSRLASQVTMGAIQRGDIAALWASLELALPGGAR